MLTKNDILSKLSELKPTLRKEYSVREIGEASKNLPQEFKEKYERCAAPSDYSRVNYTRGIGAMYLKKVFVGS